ncbi:cell wall surface anchor family protein [Rhodotorula toruloides]|uniref:Cell wall surface anchor family protein n=1 Tax=Rhodotorula toruloides TaxID=5286 RepID=A0A511KJE4_RHOTO|nr:cell wall surface anchor family protein [Rhodotorula toruloides]
MATAAGPPAFAADAHTAQSTLATATPLSSDPDTPLVASTPSSSPASASTTPAQAKPSASVGGLAPMERPDVAAHQPSAPGEVAPDVKVESLPPRDTAIVGPFTLPGTAQATSSGLSGLDGKRARTPAEQTAVDPSSAVAPGANTGGDEADAAPPPKKKRRPAVSKVYCHQDHQAHELSKVIRCTAMKPATKTKATQQGENPMKQCSASYCERCLSNRYGENMQQILSSGASSTWTCPSCRGLCTCSSCRKKLEPKPEKGVDKPKVDVLVEMLPSGGRSAAKLARSRLSATFTESGMPAAQALTNGDSSPPMSAPKKPKKLKKPRESSPLAKGKGKMEESANVHAAGLSDSGLSDLTDSDAESSTKKNRGKRSVGMNKAASASGSTAAATGPKRAMPPKVPPPLISPPKTHPLSSIYYPYPTLPCSDSILCRLHLREFFLRFLHLMPSLALPSSSSTKPPSPQVARVISALSDDILWLWTDHDSAAEIAQLRLLAGLVELLLRDRSWAIPKVQREELVDLSEEVKVAIGGVQRQQEVYDRPWRTARRALEKGVGRPWVGQGLEWEKDAKERREEAERLAKEKQSEKMKDEGNEESELSSLSGSDDDEDDEDEYDDGASTVTAATTSTKRRMVIDDDEEIDMLASDYEEPPRAPSPLKKRRKRKGTRETPAEERLALVCGLTELACQTEPVRNDIQNGLDSHYRINIDIKKDRTSVTRELADEVRGLKEKKDALEKPPGNNASSKVKEWQDEVAKIDAETKEAEVNGMKEGWRIQYEFFRNDMCNRIRFQSIGKDAFGSEYYFVTPPPSSLFQNRSAASSAFPLKRKPEDDGKRDYPLSYCVVVHGKRPVGQPDVKGKAKAEDGDEEEKPVKPDTADVALATDDWYLVRGIDDLDTLVDWVNLAVRHAKFNVDFAHFQLEHPKTKVQGRPAPLPTPEQIKLFEQRADEMDWDLGDKLRQFADAIRWTRELALEEADGGGRVLLLFTLTALAGTVYSVLNVSSAATAFRSRLPAHTLTKITESETAFPVQLSLPFFADKRNPINRLFIKRAWAWVTALFVAFLAAVLLFPSPPRAQSAPSSTRTTSNTRVQAVSTAHVAASVRRYLLASLYWFYLTQATWFGRSLGPSITFRILRSSGAVCVPSALSSEAIAQAGQGGLHSDGPHDAAAPPLVCAGAKGEYWRGGHDVSGHAFMMIHCGMFLFELVYPLLPALFPSLFRYAGIRPPAAPKRFHPVVRVLGYVAVAMIALCWWMLLMTSLFFHSSSEKLTGVAFGVLGWYISGM